MARESAYGLTHNPHHDRAAALPHWLNHYNTKRATQLAPESQPTISRVHRQY